MQKEIRWLLKEKYNNKPTKQFKKDIERLKRGEPLDYLIGLTNFLECKIDLSKKPLIPRPETEFWVQQAIQHILTNWSLSVCCGVKREIRVLDIFSGSGCIGLAVLRNVYCATVIFSDKDPKCLEQIKINCKINKIDKKRYRIIKSDVFSGFTRQKRFTHFDGRKFDFVFANPPYVALKNKKKVQKSVLKYEPKNALFGGADGLFYIKKFLKQAKNYLKPGGRIFMEFSPEQKKTIEKLLQEYNYKKFKFNKDQHGKCRWVMIK